eukprot:Awhi_evm1s3748
MIRIKSDLIQGVRGKGLMTALIMSEGKWGNAWDACLKFRDNGLIAKPTHGDIIRLTPPLCITKEEVFKAVDIIETSIKSFEK